MARKLITRDDTCRQILQAAATSRCPSVNRADETQLQFQSTSIVSRGNDVSRSKETQTTDKSCFLSCDSETGAEEIDV
jgi:hypothetical protein